MTIGDEHRRLVADFLLDLVLDRQITTDQARRLYPAMNWPGASAQAGRELARFNRQVLKIKAVPRWRWWSLKLRNRPAVAVPSDQRSARWMESAEGPEELACNCYSTWYCAVHNTGWLP